MPLRPGLTLPPNSFPVPNHLGHHSNAAGTHAHQDSRSESLRPQLSLLTTAQNCAHFPHCAKDVHMPSQLTAPALLLLLPALPRTLAKGSPHLSQHQLVLLLQVPIQDLHEASISAGHETTHPQTDIGWGTGCCTPCRSWNHHWSHGFFLWHGQHLVYVYQRLKQPH